MSPSVQVPMGFILEKYNKYKELKDKFIGMHLAAIDE
jgi:hypothetical protein